MAGSESAIIQYCTLCKSILSAGEEMVFRSLQPSFDSFALETYRALGTDYPKFHKMDRLSKLGFLSAEVLLRGQDWIKASDPARTGVILSNNSSSLDTDIKYSKMLSAGIASPAVFVYTLPNILIGEICIRHGIKGENTFFISHGFDAVAQVSYIQTLFDADVIDVCIGGWVELIGENYEAFLYLAKKGKGVTPFTVQNIEDLYNKTANRYAGVN